MQKNMEATKSDKKVLKYNTIALMIIQVLNYVLPFITLPYVSRIFRVEDFGVIFFAQVLMDYFYRLILFGFDFSAVRQIAIRSNNHKEVNHIFNSVLFVQIIFLIIGFIILNFIIFCIPKFTEDWLVYYYTYLGLVGMVFTFNWFYQGIARMKFITILNIIARVISLILIFTIIRKSDDYIWYPLINSSAMIVAGIISIIFVKKYFNIKFYLPKLKTIWEMIKYSSQFFLTKVAISLYRGTNTFVLGLVVTTAAVAYYSAADRIYWAVYGLYYTFINAFFPYMSKNKDLAFFKKVSKYVIAISIGMALFLCVASKYLIYIFYSAKYHNSIIVLQIFAVAFIFCALVDLLGFPLLGAFGYVKETNYGYIYGGIYNMIGLSLLYMTDYINIYSTAILVSSTYFVMFLQRTYYIHKYKLFQKETI